MTEYVVTAKNLALPYGARITYEPRFPLETGAFYLLTIDRLLTIGRYYHNIAGSDWIVQPGLIIQVVGKESRQVEIWGLVVPLDAAGGLDRTIGSIILAECMAIIEICDLLMPLAV